ncbi:MAG: serine hydrolase domain-containing protein [Bacteroidia bacterium]
MKRVIVVILMLYYVGQLCAQTHNTLSTQSKTKIDSVYAALMEKYELAGASIAIVDQGEIVYSTGYGFADKAAGVVADDQTIYRIGSCSKAFTVLALMQMYEAGKIDINTPIQNYLPELTIGSRFDPENKIYIRDIMAHTSGLPGDILNGFFCPKPPSLDWTIAQLNKQTMAFPRHYMHCYSNLGYGLLGKLIAEQSGQSYADYIKKNLFDRMQMGDSYIQKEAGYSLAQGYTTEGVFDEPKIRDEGAGLVHSNALDMGNFLISLIADGQFKGTQILAPDFQNEMERDQTANVSLDDDVNVQWGFGLFKKNVMLESAEDSISAEIIGHDGATMVFHADFRYIPELKVGAIIMTNHERGGRIASATRLLELYLENEKEIKLNFETGNADFSQNLSPHTEQEIIGNYAIGPFLMEVKDVNKFSIKPSPIAKIILTKKKDGSGNYSGKAILLGIIPSKIKNQEFKFVKIDDQMYFKDVKIGYGRENFQGLKTDFMAIPTSWNAMLGEYELTADQYLCEDCPMMDFTGSQLKLKSKKGRLFFELEGASEDTKMKSYLNIISDNMAVTTGIGRNMGNSFTILENGNLHFHGFEFKKKK